MMSVSNEQIPNQKQLRHRNEYERNKAS